MTTQNIIIVCCIFLASSLNAQRYTHIGSELEVKTVIKSMFNGMRAGDSTMVRNAFYHGATMQTTFTDKEGIARIEKGSLDAFLQAVGSPHDEVWDEKIWSYDIKVEDNLASVWTEYTFFLGDKMLHCGVNAFQLFKSAEGWKIIHITDTRKKNKCQG